MRARHKSLLLLDGAINLILGVVLLLFPVGVVDLLGLPPTTTNFYPSILGAVLAGIGVALLVERFGANKGVRGLGLGGAIAINVCGAGILLVWLLVDPFDIPTRGYVVLWTVATVVLVIAGVELFTRSWRYQE